MDNVSYFAKKNVRRGTPNHIVVPDASQEIEKKRASSPVPRAGGGAINQDRKVVFKTDLDQLKIKLMEKCDNMNEKMDKVLLECKEQMQEINKNVADAVSGMESRKNESLQQVLDEAVKQSSKNVHSLTDEMVRQMDQINELRSRLEEIDQYFTE